MTSEKSHGPTQTVLLVTTVVLSLAISERAAACPVKNNIETLLGFEKASSAYWVLEGEVSLDLQCRRERATLAVVRYTATGKRSRRLKVAVPDDGFPLETSAAGNVGADAPPKRSYPAPLPDIVRFVKNSVKLPPLVEGESPQTRGLTAEVRYHVIPQSVASTTPAPPEFCMPSELELVVAGEKGRVVERTEIWTFGSDFEPRRLQEQFVLSPNGQFALYAAFVDYQPFGGQGEWNIGIFRRVELDRRCLNGKKTCLHIDNVLRTKALSSMCKADFERCIPKQESACSGEGECRMYKGRYRCIDPEPDREQLDEMYRDWKAEQGR